MKPMLVLIAVLFCTNSYFAQIVKNSERMLLDTENHIVLISLKGNAIVFTMEAITDFTEDRDYTKPLGIGQDYAGIRVDVNNNNVVDRSIDVAFGIRQNTNIFCPQFLFHEYASSACGGQRSKGSVRIKFERTMRQEQPHPVFVYTIPIAELNKHSGKIGLVFQFADPQTGQAFYPSRRKPCSFDETIQLDLAEM